MLIQSVHISNFRSIREAKLDCDQLVVLIGRNGAGKSNFLKALDVFYNLSASITPEDFFARDTSSAIEIRVTFGELSPAEEAEFASYVREGQLSVTKSITFDEGRPTQKYFGITQQIPVFARIRTLSKSEQRSEWKALVESGALPGIAGSAASAAEVEQQMSSYEQEHPELLESAELEEQFFGASNIGGGKLDKYTKFVHVPAVRDAADEIAGRNSAIQQILDTLVMRKLSSREEVRRFQEDFGKQAKALFGPATETELNEVASSLSSSLATFAPGSSLHLSWGEVSVPTVQPPIAKVTLVEDDFEGDIERKGHGLQRALVLTLLRELAMLPPLESAQSADPARHLGEGKVESKPEVQVPDLILAIEEPELFLHPSRCRHLSRILLELTSRTDAPRNQVIYTTHSPHFVDLQRFDQIRRVNKIALDDHEVQQTTLTKFSRQEAADQLADLHGRPQGTFTSESFVAHVLPLMSHAVNEGFFADLAVLVEGASDAAALRKLQAIKQAGWDERGIVVISVGGKQNLDRPAIILRGLAVPNYIVFDADRSHQGGEKEEKTKAANRVCLRLVGEEEEDFPKTRVGANWAVLQDNPETVFEEELGKDSLLELIGDVADEFGYEHGRRSLKNPAVAAGVIERAYERGLSVPTFESIVDAITEYAASLTP